MDRATILTKKIEAILGLFMLLPVIIGIFYFFYVLIAGGFDFSISIPDWYNIWGVHYGEHAEGASMSPTPIFLGLIAIAAASLLKDSLRYLFIKLPPKENK